MILEIKGVGDGEHLLLVDDIVAVNKNRKYRDTSEIKWWNTIEITMKTCKYSISFQEDQNLQNEAYDKIKNALNTFYSKDSVKKMIMEALNE